jgi:hypothetical protein
VSKFQTFQRFSRRLLLSEVEEEDSEGGDHRAFRNQEEEVWGSQLGASNQDVETEPVLLEFEQGGEVGRIVTGWVGVHNRGGLDSVDVCDGGDLLVCVASFFVV